MAIDDEPIGETPDEQRLAAMRAALYRPGATTDEVQHYLDAADRPTTEAQAPVAVADPIEPEAEPPAPSSRRRAATPLLVVGVVVLLAIAAVAVGVVARQQAAAPLPSATADAPFPPVPGTPIGEMVGGADRTHSFNAGGRGAVVALHCSGTGTITVQIAEDPVGSFACSDGRTGGIRRSSLQLEGTFSVHVTATGGADWALTVGALPGG